MLNIYRSRESIDKEKFIYEDAASKGRTLVVVPDQYTLAAEKQAMDRLGTDVLLDIEITGISRLGTRLLEETGLSKLPVIDIYGRHMVISRVLRELDDELAAFKGFYGRESFVKAINDFISAAKQHEVSPEVLKLLSEEKGQYQDAKFGAFRRKLHDLALIYEKYQEHLEGTYTDNEDLIDLYIKAASKSETLAKTSIWVYGFDSFTPKNISFMTEVARRAKELNIHLIYDAGCKDEDLFSLSEVLTGRILAAAKDAGLETKVVDIKDEGLLTQKASGIKTLEKELFAVGSSKYDDFTGIEITECANIHNEAEAAAAYVLKLLKDENYRLSDIVLICNDQEVRRAVINRAFKEYGLDIFDDKKRDVLASPIAVYVTALMESVAMGYRTPDVLRMIKTGFSNLDNDQVEELENYVEKYSIKGSMWTKPFLRGEHEYRYKDGMLEEIEKTRQEIMAELDQVKGLFDGAKTFGEFAEKYQDWLEIDNGLADRVQSLIDAQIEAELMEEALESAQIWKEITGILVQLSEIMADEPMDAKMFIALFKSGLSQVQVGVLPPTADDILLGTMQRTRTGDVKALLVLGANDNLLPRIASEDVLFSREELDALKEEGQDIGIDNNLRLMEENLAIYRNLAKPSEHLWISYAKEDEAGGELRPSSVVTTIKGIFSDLEIGGDPIKDSDIRGYIGGHVNTLRHYTEARSKGRLSSDWMAVGEWLKASDEAIFRRVEEALLFDNQQDSLPEDLTAGLFSSYLDNKGLPVYNLSPTGLERYSRCPFSYFIQRGLRAEELRGDEVGGREIGELYHTTLQHFTERVAGEIGWNKIDKKTSDKLVEEIAEEWAKDYRSTLFMKSKSAEYRMHRAIEACKFVAWTLVMQAQEGRIKESLLEIPFEHRPKDADKETLYLEPIEKKLSNGKAVIRGKIDRVDILENDGVKIIDYKSGDESFDREEAAKGYRLQLMLYLEAAQKLTNKPAGVFYFLISEPQVDALKLKNKDLDEALQRDYRMDGMIVEDSDTIRDIAGDFDKESKVLKLKKTSTGWYKYSEKYLISQEDLRTLQNEVSMKVKEICQDLADGQIPLTIKVSKRKRPCDYCDYMGICRFDTVFSGCKEEIIK